MRYLLIGLAADIGKLYIIYRAIMNVVQRNRVDGYKLIHYIILVLLYIACHRLSKECTKANEQLKSSSSE